MAILTAAKREWPKYKRGPKDTLHAIAVLMLNFNEFEVGLFSLYCSFVPYSKLAEKLYFGLPERNRLDVIKVACRLAEKDQSTKECVSKLLKYFEWSMETRNNFAHAQYDDYIFERPDDNNKIYLSKRSARYRSHKHYIQPSRQLVRNAADKIKLGSDCCFNLCQYLHYRDAPAPANALQRAVASLYSSLPNIPVPPRRMRKFRSPFRYEVPQYLLERKRRTNG